MNQRLQELVHYLRPISKERFDYNHFSTDSGGLRTCGSAGCALGWCTVFWPDDWRIKLKIGSHNINVGLICNQSSDYTAAAEFFDIPRKDAADLFCPSDDEINASPNEVADKIQRYIDEHTTPEETVRVPENDSGIKV